MNALSYIRISQQDQSNYSIPNQERQIKEYCERNNLNLLATFTDNGESSYTFDRPDFKALEDFIKKNKNVQYLVVAEMDRFSRNLAEALIKIKELQDKYKIKVLATTEDFNADLTDPNAFMLRAFKFLLAENELHRIRKRTKDGLTQAALSGRFVNKAPYGYKNAKDPEGKSILEIDEEKAAHVRTIYREYIGGAGIEECRRLAKGFKGRGNSLVQRILTNPIYAGFVKAGSKLVKGIHSPIISEQDYWFVQQKYKNKGVVTQNREEVPLRGVLRSPFGELLTAGNSKSKSGNYYWYYVDKRNKLNFPAAKLHKKFDELLKNLSLSEKDLAVTKTAFEKIIEKANKTKSEDIKKTKADLIRIQTQIGNTERKFLLQPDISQETYKAVITDLKIEESRLHGRITDLLSTSENKVLKMLPLLSDVFAAYEVMDLNKKHQFINSVFNRSLSFANNIYRTPFIHQAFAHKALILKEKELLFIEAPVIYLGQSPVSSEIGSKSEHYNIIYEYETVLELMNKAI